MQHILSEIRISNYKSFKFVENEEDRQCFKLSNYTPLVGYNNAGKTNLISACQWLLRKSSLPENQFNNKNKPVEIQGVISGISVDLLNNLDKKHKKSIEKFILNETLTIKRVLDKPFLSSSKIKLLVKDIDGEWKSNPTGIDNAINAIFPEPIQINAMDNSEEDISKSKSGTTIGKLIAEIIEPIEIKYKGKVNDIMSGLKKILDADGEERAPELNVFDTEANSKLETFFPDIKVKLHVPTPELKDIFKSGTLKVYEDNDIIGKDISLLGNGAQRSIQMALIQHLADVKKAEETTITKTLLLIDEPELYLHPQAIEQIRRALKDLSEQGYQVIFATHSPHLITTKDITSTLLIRKNQVKGTFARVRMAEAIKSALVDDAPSQFEMMFALSNSSQLLFAEKVILTEGKTELRIFPIIFEEMTNKSLSLLQHALIRQGGVGNTSKSMMVLQAMDLPTKAIVDLDFAFVNAIKDGLLEADNEDIVKCKEILAELVSSHGIKLNNGLPTKKGSSMTAAEAFALMSIQTEAEIPIQNLHNELKEKNIWLWKKGAIEEHLGLTGKNEAIWAQFIQNIQDDGAEATISDFDGIKKLIEWITE